MLGLVTLLSRRYNWVIQNIYFNNRIMYYSKYEIIPVLFGVDFFKINCAVPSSGCHFLSRLADLIPSLMTPPLQVCAQNCLFVFLLAIVKVPSGSCIINTRTVSKSVSSRCPISMISCSSCSFQCVCSAYHSDVGYSCFTVSSDLCNVLKIYILE